MGSGIGVHNRYASSIVKGDDVLGAGADPCDGEEGGAAGEGVCQKYLKGTCTKGDACKYTHPKGKEGSQKGKGDKGGGRGGGGGGGGGNAAPKGPGGKGGKGGGKQGGAPATPKGGGGQPASGNSGRPTTPRSASQGNKKKFVCYQASLGKCPHMANPDKCNFIHRDLTEAEIKQRDEYLARRATSPAPSQTNDAADCPAWLKGNCPLGRKCKNRHDDALKGTKKG